MIQGFLYTNGKVPRRGERLKDPNYTPHTEPPRQGDYAGIFNGDYIKVDFDKQEEFDQALQRCRDERLNFNALQTSRGGHLYFHNVGLRGNRKEQAAACGLFCEWKFATSNETVPIKRNGIELEWLEGSPTNSKIDQLPNWLIPKAESTPESSDVPVIISEGERDDALFRIASSLRAKGLDYDEILSAVTTANQKRCNPPLSAEQVEKVCKQASQYEKGGNPNKIPQLSSHSIVGLQNKALDPIKWVVAEMLPQGLALLASPPKYGKSWLVLDLCLSVAAGDSFLKHKTERSGCLYLALEDSEHRLKDRVNKLTFGKSAPGNFDYAITAQTIDNGLIEQLEQYIKEQPQTALIVIDTLQKVRGAVGNRESAYAADYKEISTLKSFADKHSICILLVHHLRKGADDDVFNRISGTNGIFGSADTAMVMLKEKRGDENTTLSIIGRDVQSNDTVLTFDKEIYRWKVKGSVEELEEKRITEEYETDPLIRTIKKLIKDSSNGWSGTAQELLDACGDFTGIYPASRANEIGKMIKPLARMLWLRDEIRYTPPPKNGSNGKRKHFFYKVDKESIDTVDTD